MGNQKRLTVLCVVGARPNFMKIAPLMKVFNASEQISAVLVHTGQHYDDNMKQQFFVQLAIPEPDIDLGVGSGTHAEQTAKVMLAFEPVLDEVSPDVVLVVGDVNSTIATALVAVKKGISVVHVEAGLRSFDRDMPEEINRILTDQLSDRLYTTDESAESNLLKEGIPKEKISFVGNVMIDTLKMFQDRAIPASDTIADAVKVKHLSGKKDYVLLTLHRPSNVDDQSVLTNILESMVEISRELPILFPVHPRTEGKIEEFGLDKMFWSQNIIKLPPVGYLQMLGLLKDAKILVTDSGGLQEESTSLGVPCLTLRNNTERPVTITQGTNTLVGNNPRRIIEAFNAAKSFDDAQSCSQPPLWDGKAAERILADLIEHFS